MHKVKAIFAFKTLCFSYTGCYGAFCYLCLGCTIASDMNECCLCGLTPMIRSVYRTRYNINVSFQLGSRTPRGQNSSIIVRYDSYSCLCLQGSLCNDYMSYMCCPLCATCQLKRDIDLRKKQGKF